MGQDRAHRVQIEGGGGIDHARALLLRRAGGGDLAVRLVLDQQRISGGQGGEGLRQGILVDGTVRAGVDDDGVFRIGIQQDDRVARRLIRKPGDMAHVHARLRQPVPHPVIARAHRAQVMRDRARARRGDRLVRALAAQTLGIAARGQRLSGLGQALQPIDMVDVDRAQVPDCHARLRRLAAM